VGRNVRVRTNGKNIEGKLNGVDDEKIQLLEQAGKGKKKEETVVEILFKDIEKTLVLVSFK
jgi:ribosome maturation factor RimP